MEPSLGTVAMEQSSPSAEAALATRLRYEAGLAAFSTALMEGPAGSPAEINEALRHLLVAADCSRVYVAENYVLPSGELGPHINFEVCAPGVSAEIDNPVLQNVAFGDGWQRWYDTLSQGEAICGHVAGFPSSERHVLELQAIRSILVLPIFVSGEFHGFIGFDEVAHERTWAEDDVRLLRTAAEIVSAYLQRGQAEKELLRKYEQLRAVFTLGETAARAASLDEIYAAALDSLREAVGSDRASVLLFDPDGVMRFKAWLDLSDQYRGTVEGHTPWSPDTRDPEPVLSSDVASDSSMAAPLPRTGELLRDVVLREGIRALAMVPLVDQGRLLGKFMVYYSTPHRFEAGEVRLMQTLASTIAFAIARKRGEEALRQSEQRYRLFLQNFTGIAYQIEQDAIQPAFFEGAVAEITGYTPEEIFRREVDWPSIMLPQDRQRLLEHRRWLVNTPGAASDYEYRVLHKSGEVRWVRDIARQIVDEKTGRSFVQGAIYDVTATKRAEEERLEMERRLLHAQKLESLGVLAGGIAHDFNNLLLAISGNLEVAQLHIAQGPGGGERALKFVDRAMAAIDSATGLAQQMLAYSGRGQFVVRPVNLSVLVQENTELLRAAIARNRELLLHLGDVPDINADPSQIQQVIMNLITNAAEATGDSGGRIGVTTGIQEVDAAYVHQARIVEKVNPGPHVFLQVEDNGCGMAPEVQNRLFEPFYTTKFTGRGLGMAAVLGIIRSHHGAIVLDSTPGAGTRVRVLFPLAHGAKAALQNQEPAPARPPEARQEPGAPAASDATGGGGQVVLVADDEPMVREMCQALLEEWGYTVLLAADGAEAVEIFRAYADRIACVVLDLTMPRLDGFGALRAMRQIQPHVHVVLSSGYSQREALQRFGDQVTTFVQKPYRADMLRDVLDRITSTED